MATKAQWVDYDHVSFPADVQVPLRSPIAKGVEGTNANGVDAISAIAAATAAAAEGTGVATIDANVPSLADVAQGTEGTNANGIDAPFPTGADTGKGVEGENANGKDAPFPTTADKGKGAHLKPEHRWNLDVQPPNLTNDPESFDPSTTAWSYHSGGNSGGGFLGTVDNVGPNGETAAKIEFNGDNKSQYYQNTTVVENQQATAGVFIRSVSGTKDVRIVWDGFDDGPTKTVGTEWEWVSLTKDSWGDRIGFTGATEAGKVYVLKYGINRGTELDYSTKTDEPQTFEDVIAGADLQNGSTSGADTNDLKARAPGGVGSDGDDFTEARADLADKATWAGRVFIPDNGEDNFFVFGERSKNYIQVDWTAKRDGMRAYYKHDNGYNILDPGTTPARGWHTWTVTVLPSENRLRLGLNGEFFENAWDEDIPTKSVRVINVTRKEGPVISQIEKHPALTEAEAEAVRKRLATAPKDPVPPTERWDLSASANPHNFVYASEELNTWSSQDGLNVVQTLSNSPDPESSHAIEIEDPSTDKISSLRTTDRAYVYPIGSNDSVSIGLFVKKHTSNNNIKWEYNQDSGPRSKFYLDPSTGDFSCSDGSEVDDFGLIDVDSEWFYCWMKITIEGSKTDVIEIYPAWNSDALSQSGDGTATGTATFSAPRVVRGHVVDPPYVGTNEGEQAFPQTAPAQRTSENDLILGSTNNSDTNDPDWTAPKGLINDGDDMLRPAPQGPVATWIGAIETTNSRLWGRSANGWKVTDTDFVAEDENGNTVSAAHGQSLADGTRHQLAVLINRTEAVAKLYVDGTLSPVATLDLSQISTLKSGDMELMPGSGTLYDAEVYTRPLENQEALHARQRILNNPDSRIPIS